MVSEQDVAASGIYCVLVVCTNDVAATNSVHVGLK